MSTKVLKILVLIFPTIMFSDAFWWGSRATEVPPTAAAVPAMKQIPLTYFRTYTYQQPLTSNNIQLPLLSSTDYISNYNALSHTPLFNPMMPVAPFSFATNNEIPMEGRPKKSYGNFNNMRLINQMPAVSVVTPQLQSTTSTSTTTTATPEPTTTTTTESTTTTTTTEPTTTSPIDTFSSLTADSLDNADNTYPAFSRKVFTNHFNINYNRPAYPYPEYSTHKSNLNPANNIDRNQGGPNIEFMHCMCPINIPNTGFTTGYQTNLPFASQPSPNSILLAQGRTNMETDTTSLDMSGPNQMSLEAELTAGAETTNLINDLQINKLNAEENTLVVTSPQNTLT